MSGALRFVSVATATQLLLVLNQLVLLPLQLRVWGSETTAHWNVALAAAALIMAADLGLRTTGHAALLRHFDDRSDRTALREFLVFDDKLRRRFLDTDPDRWPSLAQDIVDAGEHGQSFGAAIRRALAESRITEEEAHVRLKELGYVA